MANIKSAKKRILVGERNARVNKAVRTDLKTAMKKAEAALENKTEDRADVVREAIKRLDSASQRGLIHKNNAARKKSQLTLKLNKIA